MIKKLVYVMVCAGFILSSLGFICLPAERPLPPGYQTASDGESEGRPPRYPSGFSEELLSYIPMPLPPLVQAAASTSPGANSVVSYQPFAGAAAEMDIPSGLDPFGAGNSGTADVQIESFSPLSLVANTQDWPYRANIKLYFTSNGTGYQCSGSLIDPKHVVTAAHCLYYNGYWSANVVVIPAFYNGVRPYGDANGINLWVSTDWVQYYDWNYDVGVIELDRPVGSLTGWFGYGYNTTCDFYRSGTWVHSGYPGQTPYNGLQMYTQSGVYDSCEELDGIWNGEQLTYYTYTYGGQSGTGAVRDDTVGAVLSNGNSTLSNDVRLGPANGGLITYVVDTDTPGEPDLIPLDVNISPASVPAGQALGSLDFRVVNYSSIPWSGAIDYSIYLSANDLITTEDTLLQTGSANREIGIKNSVVISVPVSPAIPAVQPAGNYYIGVFLRNADYDADNNYTDGQDAVPVAVTPAVLSLTFLSPSRIQTGTAGTTLGVDGTGFLNGAQVQWNGSARTTTFVNSTRLTAQLTAADLASVAVNQVAVVNPGPSAPSNALPVSVHTFADSTPADWHWKWVEGLYAKRITGGCDINPFRYCPDRQVTRAEMAVFILKAQNEDIPGYAPDPAQTGIFADVPVAGKEWMQAWIEEFYEQGITGGCNVNPFRYCPERQVTRAEMAVFILRAVHGAGYTPPAATGIFADVPVAGKEWMQPWIEQFYNEGITGGCNTAPLRFCPERQVTRAEMAAFIDRAFGFPQLP